MYNNITDYTNIEVSYSNEPISLSLAQTFCRVENTTTGQDQLFSLWIRLARTKVEQYTGLSLIPRNIVTVLTIPQGMMELPFGPVTSTPTFVDEEDTTQDLTIIGEDFPTVKDKVLYTKATYTAGYAEGEIPDELIQAMLLQICFYWENRGDVASKGWCPEAIAICQKWRRSLP